MIRKKIINLFTIINILFFIFNIFNFNKIIQSKPLSYDEINLKVATKSNFKDIWLGRDTINFKEFYEIGIKKINNKRIDETSISREKDNFYLRNHHGILNLILSKIFEKENFYGINDQNYFLLILALVSFTLYFKKKIPINYLINLSIFIISSTWFLYSFTGSTHHIILGMSFTIISASILEYNNKSEKNLFFLSIGVVISILTLETSSLFILLFLIFFYLKNKKNFTIKKIIKYLTIILLMILIIYPGFYITLDYLKSLLIILYRMFFDNSLNGSETISIVNFIKKNLIYFTFILFVLINLIIKTKQIKNYDTLYFLFLLGFLYILIIVPNLFSESYMFPGLMIISFVSIYSLKDEINRNKVLTLVIFSIFFFNQLNFFYLNKKYKNNSNLLFKELTGHEYSDKWEKDLRNISIFLNNDNFKKKIIYSDFSRIFKLRESHLKQPILEGYIDNEIITIPENYNRKNFFNIDFEKKNIDIILILQTRLLTENIRNKLYQINFYEKNLDLSNFTIFKKKTKL